MDSRRRDLVTAIALGPLVVCLSRAEEFVRFIDMDRLLAEVAGQTARGAA